MVKMWPCELRNAQEMGDWKFNIKFSLHDDCHAMFHLAQQHDIQPKQKAPLPSVSSCDNLTMKFPFKRIIYLVLIYIAECC